jgi:Cu+-exporting ATPase
VNFSTGDADVVIKEGHPEITTPDVIETIRGLGFGCEEGLAGNDEEFQALNASVVQRLSLNSAQDEYLMKLRIAAPLSILVTVIMVCTMKIEAFRNQMELCAALEFAFAIPVVVYCGQSFFRNAFTSAQHATCTMDTLVALGVGVAMLSSIYTAVTCWVHPASSSMHEQVLNDMHFESASNLVTVMIFGRYLECKCRSSTAKSIVMLMGLMPDTATMVVGDTELEVDTSKVRKGAVVAVRAGCRVPCDGTILRGHGFVDESMVTGEACPVEKEPGSSVICGTCLLDGVLYIEATKVGSDTSLSHIIRMVQNAQMSKPMIQKYADYVAGRFVPSVILLALICFVVWAILGATNSYPEAWRGTYSRLSFAMNFFVATVLISCPCALGLATPTAILVASGVGAQRGILVKGGDVLESCGKVRAVFFDKTGTLTDGKMTVTSSTMFHQCDVADIGALCASSTHPAATTVLQYLRAAHASTSFTTRENVMTLPGRGVVYKAPDGRVHMLGSAALLESNEVHVPADSLISGQSRVLYAVDGKLCAAYYLKDSLRPEAVAVVGELLARGVDVHVISGDVRQAVEDVATALLIDPSNVHYEMLPEDKTSFVQEYCQKEGCEGAVIFVGDGLNDAGALTAAHVGVAMANGTDISMECSDAVLTRNDLEDVITLLDLSSTTMTRIRMNFAWAMVYNLIALPLATGLVFPLVRVQVPPVVAGTAMICSSLSVLTSSLLLKRFKPRRLLIS